MQVGAVDRELRVLVAREPPAGSGDELAEAVEEGRLTGRDAGGGRSASRPSRARIFVACGRTLMPTPIGRNRGAAS